MQVRTVLIRFSTRHLKVFEGVSLFRNFNDILAEGFALTKVIKCQEFDSFCLFLDMKFFYNQ